MIIWGWRARVKSAKLVSKATLHAYVQRKGLSAQLQPSRVDQYLLFEFEDPADCDIIDVTAVHQRKRSGSRYMAVSCTWGDL